VYASMITSNSHPAGQPLLCDTLPALCEHVMSSTTSNVTCPAVPCDPPNTHVPAVSAMQPQEQQQLLLAFLHYAIMLSSAHCYPVICCPPGAGSWAA
jgi:hypothetical protein